MISFHLIKTKHCKSVSFISKESEIQSTASLQDSLDAIVSILPLVSPLLFYIILSSTAEKAPASNAGIAKGFYKIIICITINQLIQ